MKTISIKTDNPMAEIGIWDDEKNIDMLTWEGHRQLADTIHLKLRDLLMKNTLKWEDIEGIVIFKGPGSFTGLRIGMSVANALAMSLNIPIIAVGDNDDWAKIAIKRLLDGKNDKIALPEYGAEAFTTLPKK
jgi:tRNA threonylcarbamoyladenosine biosynthesis protein TsaB